MARPLGVGAHDHARPRPCASTTARAPRALDLDHAHAAGVLRRDRVAVAQRRDLRPLAAAGLEDRRAPRRPSPSRVVDRAASTALIGSLEDPELLDRRLDGVRRSLAEPADAGVAHHLGDVGEQREVAVARRAGREAGERLPPGARCRRGTARTARTTRRGRRRRSGATGRRGRPSRRARARRPSRASCPRLACALDRQRHVEVVGTDERRRPRRRAAPPAAARPARTPPASSSSSPSVTPNSTSYTPGRATAPETQNSLRPSILVPRRRRRPPQHDRQHVDERLDVVDDRRLAEQPDLDRERRLVARLAAVALDRVEDRRLLAADVGAGAADDRDVEARTRLPRMSAPR